MPIRVEGRGVAKRSESYKFLVIGRRGVGKASIIVRFVESYFHPDLYGSTFDGSVKQVIVDDLTASVHIFNSSDSNDFQSILIHQIKWGEAFLLVFSVVDRHSFDEISRIYEEILCYKECKNAPMLLVANKADLDDCDRKVSYVEGEALAKKLNIPYVECSAKSGTNVNEAFYELVRIVRKFQPRFQQPTRKKKKCTIL